MKNLKVVVTGLILMLICVVSWSQDKISDPANPEDIKTWKGKTVIYFAPHPDDEEMIAKDKDGKVYENYRCLQESLSF